jgi:Mg-chelatase subunit ChlD
MNTISRKPLLFISAFLLLFLVLPVTLFLNQKKSEIRSNAAASCGNAAIDSVVMMDISSSMNDKISGSTTTKITGAKASAKNFVDILAATTDNKVSLVSFSHTASVNQTFTTNYSSVKSQIDGLTTGSGTCHECGIIATNAEIAAHRRSDKKNAVVLLTDGRANHIVGNASTVDSSVAEQKALAAAQAGKTANGTIFYTIGLGSDVNGTFLKQLAESTGGAYYFSPSTADLNSIYSSIAQIIAKGSVSGSVFNDVNANGTYETNETKLSGWTVTLTSGTNNITAVSDNTGSYTITGLCDGSYTLQETKQTGWTQTLPINQSGYSLSVINGAAFTDKNFGNVKIVPTATPMPTTTPKPTAIPTQKPTAAPTQKPTGTPTIIPTATPTSIQNTSFLVTLFLHGIGNSGDNANPIAFSLSNKNPVHPQRPATASFYDINNILIATASGTVQYSSESGNFIGKVITKQTVTPGKYLVKVRTPYHLTRQINTIQTVTANAQTTLSSLSMVAGDVNNDNVLNILDYNTILDCYSDLIPATNCSNEKKLMTDLNDDSSVNQFDYNLFLREISTQLGE